MEVKTDMEITMFQMGFGESILLHQDDSCLLVDCGSESHNMRLCTFKKKSLLISHFHSDHTNGIRYLNEANLESFDSIFLPHIFSNDDHSIELLIAEYLLEAFLDRRRKSTQIWGCLIPIIQTNRSIILLQRGCKFNAAGCAFQTLWPLAKNTHSKILWDTFIVNYDSLNLPYHQIEQLAQQIRRVIQIITGIADVPIMLSDPVVELEDTLNQFTTMRDAYLQTIQKSNIQRSAIKNTILAAYEYIKDKNETSIVFHTADDSQLQILMTGDITQDI